MNVLFLQKVRLQNNQIFLEYTYYCSSVFHNYCFYVLSGKMYSYFW